jgi:hypothetical protein
MVHLSGMVLVYLPLCFHMISCFPDQFKSCSVHYHQEKSNLCKENPQIIIPFLTCHSSPNSLKELLNFVSLFTCLITIYSILCSLHISNVHSTATTLLSVHDYLIRAMTLHQVTCLTRHDLHADFDTLDHSILVEHLSA